MNSEYVEMARRMIDKTNDGGDAPTMYLVILVGICAALLAIAEAIHNHK